MLSKARILLPLLVVPFFAGQAHANDFPDRGWCGTKRVCVKWAPGAPGTFAGRCVKYQFKHSPYACKRRS